MDNLSGRLSGGFTGKILQVSPCGNHKASPTTRDCQGQLNQAEDLPFLFRKSSVRMLELGGELWLVGLYWG